MQTKLIGDCHATLNSFLSIKYSTARWFMMSDGDYGLNKCFKVIYITNSINT